MHLAASQKDHDNELENKYIPWIFSDLPRINQTHFLEHMNVKKVEYLPAYASTVPKIDVNKYDNKHHLKFGRHKIKMVQTLIDYYEIKMQEEKDEGFYNNILNLVD